MQLVAQKPTGVPVLDEDGQRTNSANDAKARLQATALADLSVSAAESRLQLDWSQKVRHASFYKAV